MKFLAVFLHLVTPFIYPTISRKTSALWANSKYKETKFRQIETEAAMSRLNRWNHLLDSAEYYYPQSSRDAVVCGVNYVRTPPLIVKNTNETMAIFEWRHHVPARKKDLSKDVFYTEDRRAVRNLPSHMILGVFNNYSSNYSIHGIVENPENIIYEFSIHFMLRKLRSSLKKNEYKLNTDPLSKWCYGIYYFSIKHGFE
tara:strand:+ start:6711 stop:7307 length:597 start_codon:yes stop_codon:yes gene_type:complete